MRYSAAAIVLLATSKDVSAFLSVDQHFAPGRRISASFSRVIVGMADADKPKKKLTAADIISKANEPPEPEAPKLFDDSILDDMQASLLKLEKRVKEGPGALSKDEVLEFEAATGRIIVDMDKKIAEGRQGASASFSLESPVSPSAAAAVPFQQPEPVAVSPTVETPSPPQPVQAQPEALEKEAVVDTSNDEGPAYTGKGGMGLASGTKNTYIIPGMDEMSPEEYRAALQKTISDRQQKRKTTRQGVVGNRASHSYLDTIGWGGASSSLAADPASSKKKSSNPPAAAAAAAAAAPAPVTAAPAKPVASPRYTQPDPVVRHGSSHRPPPEYEQPEAVEAHRIVDNLVQDTSNDEGPAYTGKGGMGLASGTRNTYIIPGMDEMSPEEYRAALQKSVSARQEERRAARRGVVGNRASHSYLDDIGWGGASSSLAADPASSDEN